MMLPRFFQEAFTGFKIIDVKEFFKTGRIDIYLEHKESTPFFCWRCGCPLQASRGRHRLRLKAMPIFGNDVVVHLWRRKGHCTECKKARSEAIDFISEESPHMMSDLTYWLGRICEIAPVSRTGELFDIDRRTLWNIDFARMKRLLARYKVPLPKKISVDEVYARRKPHYKGESRNDKFFTVITDLETRKVIWVSESRSKKGLDQFFALIGDEAARKIKVVATDQHDDYAASVKEHCPNATLVWDRFHLMRNFDDAVNDERKRLHSELPRGSELSRLTRGKYRFMFLKKSSRRSEEERKHIEDVLAENKQFAKLEIIKERMQTFFQAQSVSEAWQIFSEMGDWIAQAGFWHLKKWHDYLEAGWQTLKNYFEHRVTTSVSEGINNVIKVIKRKAYGYKNMEYFRLKIMQVCGYLNSRFITN